MNRGGRLSCPVRRTQVDGTMQPPGAANVSGGTRMSVEENKALVRRFLGAQAKGDLDAIEELLAPDFVDHNLLPGREDPGREGYIRSVAERHAALSDVRTTIEYQATDGEMVITRFTAHAIQDRGALFSIPATGREWVTPTIVIHRIVGRKIVEEWSANVVAPFLEKLQQEVRERERVEQELGVARRIQQTALPKAVPTLKDWQIATYYQPERWEETSTTSSTLRTAGWE